MTFHRLVENDRGKILLLNLHQTLTQKHADPAGFNVKKLDAGLKLFHQHLPLLPLNYDEDALKGVLSTPLFEAPYDYQFASMEHPDETIVLAGVRPFPDVVAALRRCLHLDLPEKIEEQIRHAIAGKPSPQAIREAADALNYVRTKKSVLSLGLKTQIFWATRKEDVKAIERKAAAESVPFVHALRDYLGLVHYTPYVDGTPEHLFLFEATVPVSKIRDLYRIRRPTTIDGFDNRRFRQYRPGVGLSGCGMTVDLTRGDYANGGPECVVTELSLQYFTCRYLGPVTLKAHGTDGKFREFLSRRPGPSQVSDSEYHAMADELDKYVA